MKNILIAVTGLTPQVVTETFFALAKKNIFIDEIAVITTERGKDVILGKDKAPNTPDTSLADELKNMCIKWKWKLPAFPDKNLFVAAEESLGMADVRNDKQNILFPNKTAEVLRQFAADKHNTLYCSISGGRKSMGVHLAATLQVYGRENDKLLHIVASDEFERTRKFYPSTKNEAKEIELSEIPFVALSPVLKTLLSTLPENYSFADIVSATRKELTILADPTFVTIDFPAKQMRSGDQMVQFEPLELSLYYTIYKYNNNEIKLTNDQVTSKAFALEVLDFLVTHFNFKPEPNDPNLKNKKWYHTGFGQQDFLSKRSKLNKKIKYLFNNDNISALFEILSDRKYRDTKYYIAAPEHKIRLKY